MILLRDWATLLAQGSAALVMAVWIYTLREQNKELREEIKIKDAKWEGMFERSLKALNDTAIAIDAVTDSVNTTNSIVSATKDVIIAKRIDP